MRNILYNGHYYMVIPKTLTWAEAKALCEAYGGHLATISHAGEQDFVAGLVQSYNYACWLGAYLDGDKWVWVNGESLVFSHWDDGEPSYDSIVNLGEGFVGMYANNTETTYATALKWNDFSGTRTLSGFVCEWEPAADPDANRTLINITKLGYTLKALSSDTAYTFRVAAVDMLGNIGEYSEPFTVTTEKDVAPPVITARGPKPSRYNSAIPFAVTVEDDSRIQTIAIQYSRDGINWITVYTKKVEKGFYSVSYTYSFSLDGHADGSIFLRAIATDEGGNLSDQSSKAPFVEYYIDKTAPAAPDGLTAAGGDGRVHLKWNLGTENDLASYTVYRSTAVGGAYTVIAGNVKTNILYGQGAV